MTTKYTEKQIADVTKLFQRAFLWAQEKNVSSECLEVFVETFADLFAEDNPPGCRVGGHDGPCSISTCLTRGFYRGRFLAACGLEGN